MANEYAWSVPNVGRLKNQQGHVHHEEKRRQRRKPSSGRRHGYRDDDRQRHQLPDEERHRCRADDTESDVGQRKAEWTERVMEIDVRDVSIRDVPGSFEIEEQVPRHLAREHMARSEQAPHRDEHRHGGRKR
jgi:hypothetical protein